MTYFTHTLKGCGTVALALVLSACGEKTTGTSAQVSGAGLEGSTNLTVNAPSTNNPNINQGQAPTSEFSSVGAPSSDQIASPDMVESNRDSSVPVMPDTPVRTDLDQIELAIDDTQSTAPIQNEVPAQTDTPEIPAAPVGDPLVSLVATTDSTLNSSGTRLVWSGENVDSCTASGAWEGAIEANGTLDLEHTQAGDLTYMISCSGASGTAMAMVTITVESTALAWQPPVQNTNGTALTDLAGYNLYYGTESGRYTQMRPVRDASQTNLELPVEPGTYYLAMTAYDTTGNESELSNEIVRHVY